MKKTLLVVLTAMILLTGRYFDISPVETLRLKTFDYYQKLQPRTATTDSVVLVEITEQDLKEYGQWPWPRDLVAQLHSKIAEQKVRAVQYNIIFAEPDRLNELAELKGEVSNDKKLASEISRTPTVFMYSVKTDPTSSPVAKVGIYIGGHKPEKFLYNFAGVVSNVPEILQMVKGAGVNIMVPNIDGTIREIPLFINSDVGMLPNQIIETVRVLERSGRYKITANDKGIESINTSRKTVIPTDKNSKFRINFAEPGTVKRYTASDLLKNRIVDLKDKIVVVGLNAAGLAYLKDTPLGLMTDAHISAQALETVFTKSQLIRNYQTDRYEILGLILIAILLISIIPRVGVTTTVGVFILLLTAIITASWRLYTQHNYLLDVSFATVFITIVWGHLTYNNFATQFRLRQQIKKQFGTYLSPAMVARLQKDPGLLKLGGDTRELSIMFTDVRGFTTISEHYGKDVQGLTKIMNRYMTAMTREINESGGTLDKYIGDAQMAFWNAPLDDAQHAKNAVRTAIKMLDSLEQFNREIKKEGVPSFGMGLGINTDSVVVGNMGSTQRFDYTCLGDGVNLAARLEGQSKNYGVLIVLGPRTAEQIRDEIAVFELDCIAVKGKTVGVKIYTVGKQGHQQSKFLDAYYKGDWKQAMSILPFARGSHPSMKNYYDNMQKRLESGLPADWDGVYRATTK
jgi:adenylate cyclase